MDPHLYIGVLAELVDGRAAINEITHHLRRYFRRIGGNALLGYSVVAGEHAEQGPLGARGMPALPGTEPFTDLFKAAQRTRRLGQCGFPFTGFRSGCFVRGGKYPYQGAYIIEACGGLYLCHEIE